MLGMPQETPWEKRQASIQRVSYWMKKAREKGTVAEWAGALGMVGEAVEAWGNYAPPKLKAHLQACYDECDTALGGMEVFQSPGGDLVPTDPGEVVVVPTAVAEASPPRLTYVPECKVSRLPGARWRGTRFGRTNNKRS